MHGEETPAKVSERGEGERKRKRKRKTEGGREREKKERKERKRVGEKEKERMRARNVHCQQGENILKLEEIQVESNNPSQAAIITGKAALRNKEKIRAVADWLCHGSCGRCFRLHSTYCGVSRYCKTRAKNTVGSERFVAPLNLEEKREKQRHQCPFKRTVRNVLLFLFLLSS